jgi:Ca2+/Na+ antiporter
MKRYKIYTFLGLAIATAFGILLLGLNGWNAEFLIFFYLSAGFTMFTVNEACEHRQKTFANQLEVTKFKVRIAINALSAFTLAFIGTMQILGDLDFPDFLFIDGWNNTHVVSTRIAWFSYVTIGTFLYQIYGLENKQAKQHEAYQDDQGDDSKRIALWSIPFRSMLFPTISIPVVVLISDSLGLNFVREFIVRFFSS